MALFGQNTVVKQIREGSLLPDIKNLVTATTNFVQGAHLIFDTAANVVRAPTAEAESNNYIGIASVDVVNGQLRSPFQGTQVDASQGAFSMEGPLYGNSFTCTLHTGVNLTPGQALFVDVATAVDGVSPSGTNQVGIYLGPSITGSAAGQRVEVLLGARWPNNVLKF